MPWVIVALFFATSTPGEAPFRTDTYNKHTFKTEAQCKDFLPTEEFAEAKAFLEAARARLGTDHFEFVCSN
jgi:hypothetical protein